MAVRPSKDGERGATLVEFALVMPILVLVLLATIEFGFAMYRLQGVHAAARDAARVGSYPTTSLVQIEDRAEASLVSASFENPATIDVTPNADRPCEEHVDSVVVEVSIDERLIVPFWDDVTVSLSSRSEFACER